MQPGNGLRVAPGRHLRLPPPKKTWFYHGFINIFNIINIIFFIIINIIVIFFIFIIIIIFFIFIIIIFFFFESPSTNQDSPNIPGFYHLQLAWQTMWNNSE
jgi:heme/copper-type cytochrome/quinol oxidase subunit 2